jgi:large subunit ribosomal protein L18
VFRSQRHLHLQLINDKDGKTLASLSTQEASFRDQGFQHGGTVPAATVAGKMLGERAKEAGIDKAVFDRGGYAYHGRVRAVADAAREAGLKF